MKKQVVFFMAFVFMAAGCTNIRQTDDTTLHPYSSEKMNGKVAKVCERMYWAVADGDNFIKGNLVLGKERDSLKWPGDTEVTFDTAGNEIICMWPDENNIYVGIDLTYYKNNKPDSAIWIWGDTLRGYAKIKCNDQGKAISYANYFGKADTLRDTWTINYNEAGEVTEYQNFDNKGILITRSLNLYNDKGQQTGGKSYNKEGVLGRSFEISYNERGKWSEYKVIDNDKKDTTVYTRTYPEYDIKGNWSKAITRDNKGHALYSERVYLYFQ